MIVAAICGVQIDEQVIQAGSNEEKQLQKASGSLTFPILQVDENTYLNDSCAIVAHIARCSGNTSLLGQSAFHEG